jgi:hypothetical protein
MSVTVQGHPVRGNHLLSQLSDDAYASLAPSLEHVQTAASQRKADFPDSLLKDRLWPTAVFAKRFDEAG